MLELLSLADGVEVFFHVAGDDKLYIGLWFVIDQEVQFAAVEPCFGKFVFHGDTVDREAVAIGEDSLYAVGIEVKAAFVNEHYLLPPLW